MDIQVGDILTMKKEHPCGSKQWEVLRTGADFRLRCCGCGREVWPQLSPCIMVLITRGNEALLVHAATFRGPFFGLVAGFVETGETLEDGIRVVQQLLAEGIRPDGILCGEDLTAAGVLKALLRAGIRVPEETAVVGYDNSTYARLCEPELTSVDNKPEQVALLCVQLLQSRIEHGEDYSSVTLQPELVQRQSS